MKIKILYICIICLVVILIAGGLYYFYNKTEKNIPAKNQTSIADYESYLNKPYQFSDFHVDFKEYKANYWNDWKEIFADVNSSDHDFAGHFKLFSSGNGNLRELFLVDGLTGTIYPYDDMMTTGPSKYIFKKDSNLLIEVLDNEFNFLHGTTDDQKTIYIYYLLKDDKTFKLLGYYTYKNNSFKLLGNYINRDNSFITIP
ncbi:MAG: hypothetical protein NT094_04960 [Candidatus Staskawiczbacteria bacterium]|nr:hypothetical protein [Candidatus Staskawiczbacteria bacterium]